MKMRSPYVAPFKSQLSQWSVLAVAISSVLLGLVMMMAWHLRLTPIIQITSGSPPIRYNIALAFLLSGLALFLLRMRQPASIVPSTVVTLIGALTLLEYIWNVDFGIDQLLMQDYITNGLSAPGHYPHPPITEPVQQFFITVAHPLPGRPAPNAALGFLLIGIALLCLQRFQAKAKPQKLLGAIAGCLSISSVSIGLIALLGYATELSTANTWRYLSGIAIPTALGLVGLGFALWLETLIHHSQGRPPRWFPLSVGFGVFTATLFLWQALVSWNRNLVGNLSGFATEVKLLLTPVANIVLVGGLLLAILVTWVLYIQQKVKSQAERLKHLNHGLAEAKSMLEATLDATADGILVIDASGHRQHFNQRFVQMWGFPEAVVHELRVDQQPKAPDFLLAQLRDPDAFVAATKQMISQPEGNTFDVFELKDGQIFERHSRPQWIGDRPVGRVLSYRDITTRHRAEAALRESEERYRSVIAAMAEGIVLQDKTGVIQTSNARAEEILGLTVDQLQGRTSIDPRWCSIHEDGSLFPGDQHPGMVTLRTGQPHRNVIMGVHKPDGTLTWISINTQPLFQPQHTSPYAVVASFSDITERKQMEEALFQEKELAQVTLHSIGDAVITTNAAACIEYVNPIAEALTGWTSAEAVGLPLRDIFHIIHEETRDAVDNPVEQALKHNQIVELERDTVLISRDGQEIAIDDSAAPIRNRQGDTVGAVMVFHDVTQTRSLSRQVSWQAMHDALTGLVNRHEFERRLEQAIVNARQQSLCHALCYLDLDQFKIVNDTCGHTAGDELLRQVTALLQTHIRKTDTLARLGGDEFGVLLHQCLLEQAIRVANLLREQIQAFRFVWQNNTFSIGVSIGLVPINAESDSLSNLLIAADSACYVAKSNGRNRIHVFQTDDQDLLKRQGEMLWVTRLNQALEQDRFCLYTQKIAAIAPNGEADHCEVLLRLHDLEGALITPMAFIPAAERYGLMHKIDRWVVSTIFRHLALSQAQATNGIQPKPCIYAINLSGHSINDEQFINFLYSQFEQHQVKPHLICFEITETVAIANLTKASQFIRQLQKLGCQFALDDFGSGMSSFAYLKNLSVDYLKIDGGFVKNIITDPVDEAMVAAITKIGHVMGIKTVAEFVENEAILERLRDIGVDYAQGYGIEKPHPLICHASIMSESRR